MLRIGRVVIAGGVLFACSTDFRSRAPKEQERLDASAESGSGSGGTNPGAGGAAGTRNSGGAGGAVATAGRPQAHVADAASDALVKDAGADGSSCDGSDCADASAPCSRTEECPADRYCGAMGRCVRCTDLGTTDPAKLRFGDPEALSVVNASADQENLRNPRVFDGGSKLLYVHDFLGYATVWLTADFRDNAGSPLPAPVDGEGSESSGLKVSAASGVFGGYNFFFDRSPIDDAGRLGARIMYGAHVDGSGRATAVTALPAPFNDPPRSGDGLALSQSRAFWTERLDDALNVQLWTAPVEGDIIGTRVNLTLPNGCSAYDLDYTVWAAWDGKFILIGYNERDEKCAQSPYWNDVGLVRVNSAGQAIGNIVPLDVNLPAVSDNDPSLSPDMCWLYFSSTRHVSKFYRIYRARRLR